MVTQTEQCQSLLEAATANPLCSQIGNCTGLRCEQRNNALDGSSASFGVIKCEDPVIASLTIQSRAATALFQQNFTQNDTVFIGGNNSLSIAMQRNASHLKFQVIKIIRSLTKCQNWHKSLILFNAFYTFQTKL